MSNLKTTVLSVWSWFAFGLLAVIWLPAMVVVRVVTAPFDRGRYWAGYLFRKLPVAHQTLNPLWHFSVEGEMPSDPRNPYVVVANHESFVDILLISHLPWEMKWLSKASLFKIPVAGWMMSMAGDVRLQRGDSRSAAAAMAQCSTWLDRRVSVMIFPEGTRTRSGEMAAFKDGAFRLAIENQLPILPLAVFGTRTALEADGWRQGRSNAIVRVLEPVSTAGLSLDDIEALKDDVRASIVANVEDLRSTSAASAEALPGPEPR